MSNNEQNANSKRTKKPSAFTRFLWWTAGADQETLMRLVMTGTPREEAMQWMACALAVEVSDVMENGASFNAERYNQHLDELPNMDWIDD